MVLTKPHTTTDLGQVWESLPRQLKLELIAIQLEASASEVETNEFDQRFTPYQFKPFDYFKDLYGVSLWRGRANVQTDGQADLVDDYLLALRQLHEKRDYENGIIPLNKLEYWNPGTIIKNWLSVDAGHTVGKTFLLSQLVSHFFDCFAPSIVYCYAPKFSQIKDLLFKEIRIHRTGRDDLRGRVYRGDNCRIEYSANHFVTGVGLDNSHGQGGEKVHGQHEAYQMFVIDEAEGVPDYLFESIESMTSGGMAIVVLARNPRTTTCAAHKVRSRKDCRPFRISCLEHPNVIQGREVIPKAVTRSWVELMCNNTEYCDVVTEHNPDIRTFELTWNPGIIYKPKTKFKWRVLGIPDTETADNTFCPSGRYESALKRTPPPDADKTFAFIGVDVARYGNDNGTIYTNWGLTLKRVCVIQKKDGYEYYIKVKAECLRLHDLGVRYIEIRVDGGGGYGSTCIDNLSRDGDMIDTYGKGNFKVIEVLNNHKSNDSTKFKNRVTELYYYAGEAMKDISLLSPPIELKSDLCERFYAYVGVGAYSPKKLEDKEKFKKRNTRSPDDGDGAALALAPKFIFGGGHISISSYIKENQGKPRKNIWDRKR